MSTPTAPSLIVFPVADLDAAKTLYSAVLGTAPYADAPYYVGYRVGDVEIGLDPNGARQGTTTPITYWSTDDIAGRVAALVAAGPPRRLARPCGAPLPTWGAGSWSRSSPTPPATCSASASPDPARTQP